MIASPTRSSPALGRTPRRRRVGILDLVTKSPRNSLYGRLMAIIRPLTGSGSAGIVVDMIKQYGEDSILVKMAAVMFGSTETTFYVIAVYFGAVNIRKTRHAVPAGLIADGSAMVIAVWMVRLLFG